MTVAERFWSKVQLRGPNDCWPWTAAVRKKSEGYGAFWLNGRHQPAHRVALELATGVVTPAGMAVCHRCDNPPCCNPAHLFVGTPQDNDTDRVLKGRQVMGERINTAKLTERKVVVLRKLQKLGFTYASLADYFGIDKSNVGDIVNRKYWKQVA